MQGRAPGEPLTTFIFAGQTDRMDKMSTQKKKLTITDVAAALDVSKTTISRAISGKGRIGAETRKRVLEFIEENGYVPNVVAKGLAQSRTYNIGLCIPKDSTVTDLPFFNRCMIGVTGYAGEMDYDVVVTMISNKDISALQRLVENRKIDGAIVTRTLVNDPAVELLKDEQMPFVTIGSYIDPEVVQIDNDHRLACNTLTSILFRQGMKKIALLCGNANHVVTANRLKGFVDACNEAGIKNPASHVFRDNEGPLLEKNVDLILDEEYDCIICMDDSLCMRVLDKLKAEGVSVPNDIYVASFYNSKALERNIPAITSLKFDAKELGATAARILIEMLAGREVAGKTLLGYEILIKESTQAGEIRE